MVRYDHISNYIRSLELLMARYSHISNYIHS